MIKVLHVVNSLNINAGQMSVVMNYYRNINRDEIQFDFLYFQELPEDHKCEIDQLGGHYYSLGRPSFGLSYQKKLNEFFKEHAGEYCAVHCHPIWAAEIVAVQAKRNGIKHIIAHSHSTKYSEKKISAIRNRFLMNFIGWFATDYISCTPEAAFLFGKKRATSGQVKIFVNAIDIDNYQYSPQEREKIRKKCFIESNQFVIGTVGRLSPEKNQIFLIDMFNEYIKYHPDSILLIVGEGASKNDLIKRVDSLQLQDKVILAGKQKDIPSFLSAMDIFILPSIFEGAPVSAIEAQANGLFCIMSSSITKTVKADKGYFCNLDDDICVWCNTIDKLRTKNNSRNVTSELLRERFDIQIASKCLENYYKELQ